MTPPTLPTDSLYKFATVGGLVLLTFSLAYPPIATQSLHREYTDHLREANQIAREVQLSLPRDEETGKPVSQKEAVFRAGLVVGEMQNLDAWFEQRKAQLNEQLIYTTWARWIGGFIFAVSLVMWWVRHQRHQDALLFAEATEAKARAKKATT